MLNSIQVKLMRQIIHTVQKWTILNKIHCTVALKYPKECYMLLITCFSKMLATQCSGRLKVTASDLF